MFGWKLEGRAWERDRRIRPPPEVADRAAVGMDQITGAPVEDVVKLAMEWIRKGREN